MTDMTVCPVGKYCPASAQAPTDCPIGTYNAVTGATDDSYCLPCKSGQFCATTGLSAPTGDCSEGYYCIEGASSATPSADPDGKFGPCTTGNYCPTKTGAPIPCPPGTFRATTGAISEAQCTSCTAGKYCLSGGLSAVEGDCAEGFYCPEGTVVPTPTTSCAKG